MFYTSQKDASWAIFKLHCQSRIVTQCSKCGDPEWGILLHFTISLQCHGVNWSVSVGNKNVVEEDCEADCKQFYVGSTQLKGAKFLMK